MNNRFLTSVHWTEDQLLEYLYGIGPADKHVEACEECRSRLAAMQLSRNSVEAQAGWQVDLNADTLAAQRRAIYARLERTASWWPASHFRKWAPAACALLVLCGGFAAWEHQTALQQQSQALRAKVSDAQLADEVSQVADDVTPDAVAPLHALFEN